MMMLPYWAKIIRARSFSRGVRAATVLFAAAFLLGAQSLESQAHAFREKPTPALRASLLRFAEAHPADTQGAQALFAVAIWEKDQHQFDEAIKHLKQARGRLPQLADYVSYYLAAAESDLGSFPAAIDDANVVLKASPASPMVPDAAMVAARAYKETGSPTEAVRVLRAAYTQLQQPEGDLLAATCYRAANDLASAAVYYQHVYYQHPATPEAEQASAALAELKTTLGALYPPPAPQAMLLRAERWLRVGDTRRARSEYESIIAQSTGADREVARVRIAELDYFRYENLTAYRNLRSLEVSSPEADAERLYYMVECARRLDRDDQIADAINRLAERYPQSPWRLKALITACNRYLIQNQPDKYLPLYSACYQSFPSEPQAAQCHWKVTWNAYFNRRSEARELLREHILKFPGSDHASAALYYLGRNAESHSEPDAAKAYYSALTDRFPNYYYADLADQRLADPVLFRAVVSPGITEFLNSVVWPVRQYPSSFEPTPETRAHMERARLLDGAGLDDLVERELRFGARTDGQPHVLAIQLAQSASKYGSPHRAIRLVKNLVPGYMTIPVDSAPAAFWRLLFPMPWRPALERYSNAQGLDPFIVAGLIRQESEFNPEAVSPAHAYGLTQVLPSTGRSLLRVSRRRFRPSILFQPEVNLRLGTTFLKMVYNGNSAKWEQALAAYNAGASRVQNWLTWGQYREPAEFIETIPFSETRTYVFAVLRNAHMYRTLYSSSGPGMLASDFLSDKLPVIAAKRAAPTRKAGPYKRSPVVVAKKHRSRRRPPS